jgi:hypothetical protein
VRGVARHQGDHARLVGVTMVGHLSDECARAGQE